MSLEKKHTPKELDYIAMACHEANRALCLSAGDVTQAHWEEAEPWQRASAISGVLFRLENPNAPASAQHDAWCKDKVENGWVYGKVKDASAKMHPCLVAYEELPEFQRRKDVLFQSIVDALT